MKVPISHKITLIADIITAVKNEFDPKLKAKHMKIVVQGLPEKVYEATGYYINRGGHKFIQVIRKYTIYHQPLPEMLLESHFKETNEPLTKLKYMEDPNKETL